jgi:ketosteroid isomerase-like protein
MTDDRLASLEATVQRLVDIEDLRMLRLRYHDAVNENRPDDIAALFTEDGEVDFGYLGATTGRPKVARFFGKMGDVLESVVQFMHNHVIEVDGDEATGSAYLEAKTVSKGVAHRVAGRYRDTYRRTPEGWRFARMQFEPLFTLPFEESWAATDRLRMGR